MELNEIKNMIKNRSISIEEYNFIEPYAILDKKAYCMKDLLDIISCSSDYWFKFDEDLQTEKFKIFIRESVDEEFKLYMETLYKNIDKSVYKIILIFQYFNYSSEMILYGRKLNLSSIQSYLKDKNSKYFIKILSDYLDKTIIDSINLYLEITEDKNEDLNIIAFLNESLLSEKKIGKFINIINIYNNLDNYLLPSFFNCFKKVAKYNKILLRKNDYNDGINLIFSEDAIKGIKEEDYIEIMKVFKKNRSLFKNKNVINDLLDARIIKKENPVSDYELKKIIYILSDFEMIGDYYFEKGQKMQAIENYLKSNYSNVDNIKKTHLLVEELKDENLVELEKMILKSNNEIKNKFIYKLGIEYYEGKLVKRNLNKAILYLNDSNTPEAKYYIGKIYKENHKNYNQFKIAHKNLKFASDNGEDRAREIIEKKSYKINVSKKVIINYFMSVEFLVLTLLSICLYFSYNYNKDFSIFLFLLPAVILPIKDNFNKKYIKLIISYLGICIIYIAFIKYFFIEFNIWLIIVFNLIYWLSTILIDVNIKIKLEKNNKIKGGEIFLSFLTSIIFSVIFIYYYLDSIKEIFKSNLNVVLFCVVFIFMSISFFIGVWYIFNNLIKYIFKYIYFRVLKVTNIRCFYKMIFIFLNCIFLFLLKSNNIYFELLLFNNIITILLLSLSKKYDELMY